MADKFPQRNTEVHNNDVEAPACTGTAHNGNLSKLYGIEADPKNGQINLYSDKMPDEVHGLVVSEHNSDKFSRLWSYENKNEKENITWAETKNSTIICDNEESMNIAQTVDVEKQESYNTSNREQNVLERLNQSISKILKQKITKSNVTVNENSLLEIRKKKVYNIKNTEDTLIDEKPLDGINMNQHRICEDMNHISTAQTEYESDEFELYTNENAEIKALICGDKKPTKRSAVVVQECNLPKPFETPAMRSKRLQAMFETFHKNMMEIRAKKLEQEANFLRSQQIEFEKTYGTKNNNDQEESKLEAAIQETTGMLDNVLSKYEYQSADEIVKSEEMPMQTVKQISARNEIVNEPGYAQPTISVQATTKPLPAKKPCKNHYYLALPQHRQLLLCKPCLYDPSPLIDPNGNVFCPYNCGCCLCPWLKKHETDAVVLEKEAPTGTSTCNCCNSVSSVCYCCYQAERKHEELYGVSMWSEEGILTKQFEGSLVPMSQVKKLVLLPTVDGSIV